MDNYGEPIFNKNNILIGYKINNYEYATVNTFINIENKKTNEVSIKIFDKSTLTFSNDVVISWIDTKNNNGFIRDFNGFSYFYFLIT